MGVRRAQRKAAVSRGELGPKWCRYITHTAAIVAPDAISSSDMMKRPQEASLFGVREVGRVRGTQEGHPVTRLGHLVGDLEGGMGRVRWEVGRGRVRRGRGTMSRRTAIVRRVVSPMVTFSCRSSLCLKGEKRPTIASVVIVKLQGPGWSPGQEEGGRSGTWER